MIVCPHCHSDKCQIKAGRTRFSSQRYFCEVCQRTCTPQAKPQGYPAHLRQEAVRYSLEGLRQRKIAHLLHVSHSSVANWQDEVYTFCGAKRTQ